MVTTVTTSSDMNKQEKTKSEFHISKEELNGILVECPMANKDLRPVLDCLNGCQHFANFRDRFPGDSELPFNKRFLLGCRYPSGRTMFKLRDDNDSSK